VAKGIACLTDVNPEESPVHEITGGLSGDQAESNPTDYASLSTALPPAFGLNRAEKLFPKLGTLTKSASLPGVHRRLLAKDHGWTRSLDAQSGGGSEHVQLALLLLRILKCSGLKILSSSTIHCIQYLTSSFEFTFPTSSYDISQVNITSRRKFASSE